MSSRFAVDFRFAIRCLRTKARSNPDAVTGAVLVASGLKAVPDHASLTRMETR